jgi:hypothetical protein
VGELVQALLDLFTKTVGHVFSHPCGRGGRSYTPSAIDPAAMRPGSARVFPDHLAG